MPCARRFSPIHCSTSGRERACCSNARTCSAPARSKFRGAYNAIAALSPEVRAKGIVGVSSGNHAQGVAEAARLFGVAATIVMPADAPAIKRERTERSGGRIVTYDRRSEDRDAVAGRHVAEHGGTLIHPFNDAAVIAGQGTMGLEIAADCHALGLVPDEVIVPCGGGGLAAGVGLALRDAFPSIALTLVEPDGFDDYRRSLAADRIVANAATAGSICDALLAPSPGDIGFALNRANGARAVSVSDAEALAAVAFAFHELKLVVEPGGAVALAALLSGRHVSAHVGGPWSSFCRAATSIRPCSRGRWRSPARLAATIGSHAFAGWLR